MKSAANMKLSSDASVLRITCEGLTKFQSFIDFDHNSIKSTSKACSNNIDRIVADVPNLIASENATPDTNISTISILRLVVANNAVKYYTAIGRTTEFDNIHYVNVLGEFKTDYYTYTMLKEQTLPEALLVVERNFIFSLIWRCYGPKRGR